jgi:hypothetical protein
VNPYNFLAKSALAVVDRPQTDLGF